MLEKLDKRTSVSQQVASFSIIFPSSSGGNFAVSSTPKTSKNHTEKTRFSHNEGENCGEKKKGSEGERTMR
jgi:hypothetical protein